MNDFADYVLGDSKDLVEVDRSEAVRAVALSMVNQSQRTLDIISRHLDPVLFDNEMFAGAVRSLAIRSSHSRIRLLVQDPAPVVAAGHRLVNLAMQLSSYVSLRVPGADHRRFNEAWLIADNTGYIRRVHADRYDGVANFADRRYATELAREFDDIWERAAPDPNLRRLNI